MEQISFFQNPSAAPSPDDAQFGMHVDERALRPASPEAVQRFLHTLESRHISATVRREMGSDIGGACGQLRRRELEGKSKE